MSGDWSKDLEFREQKNVRCLSVILMAGKLSVSWRSLAFLLQRCHISHDPASFPKTLLKPSQAM